MTLGELLRQARKKKGMKIRELAKLVGVSHVSIYHYEQDNHTPRITHLKWLAQALDIKLEELIERL
jgi:transcriptional regulator with XRE-family HTH domain